jgi:hypothetical protein
MSKGQYYRVKLAKHMGGKWTVAEYLGNGEWFLCGNECEVGTRELARVGSAVRLPRR